MRPCYAQYELTADDVVTIAMTLDGAEEWPADRVAAVLAIHTDKLDKARLALEETLRHVASIERGIAMREQAISILRATR